MSWLLLSVAVLSVLCDSVHIAGKASETETSLASVEIHGSIVKQLDTENEKTEEASLTSIGSHGSMLEMYRGDANKIMRSHGAASDATGRQADAKQSEVHQPVSQKLMRRPFEMAQERLHGTEHALAKAGPVGQQDARHEEVRDLRNSLDISGPVLLLVQRLQDSTNALHVIGLVLMVVLVVLLSVLLYFILYRQDFAQESSGRQPSGEQRRNSRSKLLREQRTSSKAPESGTQRLQSDTGGMGSDASETFGEQRQRSDGESSWGLSSDACADLEEEMTRHINTVCGEAMSVLAFVDGDEFYEILDAFAEAQDEAVQPAHNEYGHYLATEVVQEQITNLFAAVRMSEDLVDQEGLQAMCSGFRIHAKNPKTGNSLRGWPYTPQEDDYEWLIRSIQDSNPQLGQFTTDIRKDYWSKKEFVNVFVLWHMVALQIAEIKALGTAEAEGGRWLDLEVQIELPDGQVPFRSALRWCKMYQSDGALRRMGSVSY